eukprot:CAMPEP_0194268830 /NCGR_PEP_ID=MMETSP0169-20130528/3090_1 /TAXON_ID=218684 /ORGANISM="Corethron pennatum, Strain L29A3" /LENGTH=158 /DNA_ID=CAMNT_0039010227 /DNA_START=148 /DNA_END=624 /DNA_ORIENTATION=-
MGHTCAMRAAAIVALALILTGAVDALAAVRTSSRRQFFGAATAGAAASFFPVSPGPAAALDMDAFVNSELAADRAKCDATSKDSKCVPDRLPTPDESLCRFGSPSKGRGEACIRAGMSTANRGSVVDAFGKVDRGTYERCKDDWNIVNGKYEKSTICK